MLLLNSVFLLFMEKLLTGDGSFTFVSSEFEEAYHSVTGAEEEALKKFAEPTEVRSLQSLVLLRF